MTNPRQRGFTLIELIIFIVVVGIGLAGILSVINTVVKSSADPMVRKQSIAIAESLLEEILLKDYSSPSGAGNVGSTCSAASGARAHWDNVCDYSGYFTSAGIQDMAGAAVPGLTSFNIAPAVEVVASSDLTGVAARKVTVRVTDSAGNIITLIGYRANDQ